MVGMVGIEPTRPLRSQDFKSCAYASFATSPSIILSCGESPTGGLVQDFKSLASANFATPAAWGHSGGTLASDSRSVKVDPARCAGQAPPQKAEPVPTSAIASESIYIY